MKTGTGLIHRALVEDLTNMAADTYRRMTVTERYESMRVRAFREGVASCIGNLATLHIIEVTESDDPQQLTLDNRIS